MKRKTIYGSAVILIMSAFLYNMFIEHDSRHDLTDIALLNVEALASYEAEPIRLKSCYTYASSTLLPDEPATYVTKCSGCATVKVTLYVGSATCAGSQIIY